MTSLWKISLTTLLGLFVFALVAMTAEPRSIDQLRADAKKLFAQGNYKDALAIYRDLVQDPKNAGDGLAEDYRQGANALQNLNDVAKLDDWREDIVKRYPDDWKLLAAVAYDYANQQHYGFIVAGKFERGSHRGGGEWANVGERDYVRGLQLLRDAVPLVEKSTESAGRKADFYFQLAYHLQNHPLHGTGFHFQLLTDLAKLPEPESSGPAYGRGYGRGFGGSNARRGYPVDADGRPIFYKVPTTWDKAANDGERWRWALSQALETDAAQLNRQRWQFASFWQALLGEQTAVEYGYRGSRADDGEKKPDADGPYSVHTLTEDETICRLATGVKRITLPDEFNWIKIYGRIADEPQTRYADSALDTLAGIFENRRQYVKATEIWKRAIKEHGPGNNDYRKKRLDQIVGNWGRFENTTVQVAGVGAEIDFTYRNAKKVVFTAHAIKFEKLLDDVKTHLKSRPNRVDWQKTDIQNVGQRIYWENEKQYLGEQVAEWTLDLNPPEGHTSQRVRVSTPLQKAGAYMLTGKLADGNETRIVIWVADTAIVRYQLDERVLYVVTDAATGKPLEKANLEVFGYQQKHIKNNDWQIDTKQFAEFTDADGRVILGKDRLPDNYQWLVIARTDQGRFAHLGFQGVWFSPRYDAEYDATKVFAITDRPVYRPAQKVQFKFWVRHTKYDQPDASDFAGQTFNVEIHNPKGERVLTKTLTADEYGGLAGDYELPADATLGVYQLVVVGKGGGSFRVEEYKKPEFEVTVAAPTEAVMLGEKITADVKAKYYFGAPVAKGKIHYKVLRSSHNEQWYPICPWDWFYGRGYCWFAYDYTWYPGWNEWGCKRPYPFWRPFSQAQPEVVLDAEAELAPDGTFKIEIDTAAAKAIHGDQDHKYAITAEVVDESRRTIVGTGNVIVARKPFQVTAWIDRGYLRPGQAVTAQFKARTPTDKHVQGTGELTLFKISYDADGKPTEKQVQRWALDTDVEGSAKQQFVAAEPGQYRLSYKVTDAKKHEVEGGYVFNVLGAQAAGDDFRFEEIELLPEMREYAPGEKVKLVVNTARANSTVYLFVRPTNGVYLEPRVLRLQGKSTTVELDVVTRDMPNFFVEAMTVADAKVYSETKEIVVPPEKRILNIAVDPSKASYKPGEKGTIKLRLTDHLGENFVGSTVVAIYDKSVDYISGGGNVPEIKEFFWKWRRHHSPQHFDNLTQYFTFIQKRGEEIMAQLGVFGYLAEEVDQKGKARFGANEARDEFSAMPRATRSLAAGVPNARGMRMDAAKSEAGEKAQSGGFDDAQRLKSLADDGAPPPNLVEPSVRSKFADTALWVGSLTTAKDGTAEVELTMPENLTAWKVKVWGMGHGTKVGQGDAEVVTAKDVIVRLQAPRFFVETDEVVLSANVHNYLKTAKDVVVKLELPNDTLALLDGVQAERTIKIPAGGEERVDWRVKVVREGEALVRMSARTDEDSDAMEQKFPVYVHGILKTESFSGMLRLNETAGKLDFTVPAERRVEQSRVEVRYSPTLAGACVDALPYLVEYPYGCTEQTLNRFVPTVVTQKILQRMGLDLKAIETKRTNLNAQELGDPKKRAAGWKRFDRNPVFDNAEVTKMVKSGVERLTEMQCSDGGWGWFSGYGEHSSAHTTAVVVHGLQLAKSNDVALVPGTLEKGIEWLKRYEAEQVRLLKLGDQVRDKKGAWEKIGNYRLQVDNLDALVAYVLSDADHKNAAMTDYLYRDRTHLAVYAKALFGLALHAQGDKEKLDMILKNIAQFVVVDDENQTAYLKLPQNDWWWSWYGSEIEAHSFYLKLLAKTEPQGDVAPKLVKYLLNNRRHGTYWNSTRDTAYAIEALADYLKASGEDKPDLNIEVWLDGKKHKEVKVTAADLFTMDNTFTLEGKDVTSGKHTLELKKSGKGPLYYNAYVTNFTLEDRITRAGLEVKVNRKFYKLVKADKTVAVAGSRGQAVEQKVEKYDRVELADLSELKSGELLEVELEIDSKNDYEYVLFEDLKAAGCEAVDVRSGYTANSMNAYVEFRDNRVGFFIRALARGKHSVSYRLRAEIPGRFSALPAQAQAMYAPELKANSDEFKLKITD